MEEADLVPLSPHHNVIFPFERNFDKDYHQQWMSNNWQWSTYAAAVYIFIIVVGRALMNKRSDPFSLQIPLILWNFSLAIFSIAGAIRAIPELLHILKHFGFRDSICRVYKQFDEVSGFWIWLFIVSKIVELVDTLFLVLRKKNVMLLHWYHHVTVLVYCWYAYHIHAPTCRWFACMNLVVHSVMYSYYMLAAMKIKMPKALSMVITVMQIMQMTMGTFIALYAYKEYVMQNSCELTGLIIFVSIFMYGSYLLLFVNFFFRSYFAKSAGLPLLDPRKRD